MEEMATKEVAPCVGSTSEDPTEEEFKNKSWRTDVTLKVEDRLLYVSKHVLGAASPVFDEMFDCKNEDGDLNEILLPGKKCSDVLEFLRCIYPNVLKPVTMANVFSVLPLAVEYQVTHLKQTCESYLLKCLDGDISTELLCFILNIAHTTNVQNVFAKCIEIAITRESTDVQKACNEVSLPLEVKESILSKRCTSIETKYKKLLNENNSARTLCSFIGIVSKRSSLVHQFLQGNVIGKSFSFAIKYPYDKTFDIDVDRFKFTICFDECNVDTYRKKVPRRRALLKCNNLDLDSLRCTSLVILKNWMEFYGDIEEEEENIHFEKNTPSDKGISIFCVHSATLADETKGFIYKGVSKIVMYLFINH
ncbi:hypothetical protein ACF0H5_008169 [Mactra antiquata]